MSVIITSVFVMTAAILIRKAFSKKLSGRALMVIWAIVFIKLAVPVSIPASFSVMNLIAEKPAQAAAENKPADSAMHDENRPDYMPDENTMPVYIMTENTLDNINSENNMRETAPVSAGIKISFWETVNTVYVIAAAVLTAGVLLAYAVCAVRFGAFEDIAVPEKFAEKGIKFRKGNVGTPAVFGIFRPVILLPIGADIENDPKFEHIILHEKTHIRHRDQLFNLLTLIICCLNWYDPLAWICRALYLKDAEKWCDESVIEQIGRANRRAYAESLLACAAERSGPFALVSGFGENDIKGRIISVMYDKKFKRGASIAVVALAAVLFAAIGTGASAAENKPEPNDTAVSAVTEIKDEPEKNNEDKEPFHSSPEYVKLSALPDAEQIYSSLYNLAEFENYITFGLSDDIDISKPLNIERIHFPAAGLPKEKIGTTYYETFYLIKSGRLSSGADFSAWLNTFASSKYITKEFREWYKEKFVVSEEKIYVSEYTAEYIGNWLVTGNFTLDSITALDKNFEGDREKIQLDFSFINYGIDIGSMPEKTEYLTVVTEYEDGWKIYSYSGGYGMTALINELIRNEEPSGLQEQIKNYLLQNPVL